MCALCFANGMVSTEDVLDREDIVKQNNGGPTVNAKVTCPAVVHRLAPKKAAKIFHDFVENIFTPNIFRRF